MDHIAGIPVKHMKLRSKIGQTHYIHKAMRPSHVIESHAAMHKISSLETNTQVF